MSEKKVPEVRFRRFSGEWERLKLSDVADIVGGGTPSTQIKEYWNGEIAWYSPTEIGGSVYADRSQKTITELGFEKCSAKMLPANTTVLFTSRAGIGDMAILRHTATTNQGFQSFVMKNGNNTYFLYSSGCYIKSYALKYASGSTFLEISGKQLGEMDYTFPDEKEQTKIGDFFKNLDNLIAQNQKKYDKLVNMKKACLDKMFPKDGTDTPEVKFKRFDGKWEKKKLESTVDFWDEQRKPISAEIRESGIYPYYGASGIIDYVKDYLFAEELVLLSEDGANIIDRNYRVSFLAKGKYWVNNHAHVLKSKQGYCNGFICEELERLNYERYNTGTAQPKLNQEVCRNIVIMVPTFEEQQQIFIFFQTLDNLVNLQKTKLEKLKNIKKACLDKMFI